ncbi:hypothetical protein GQ457_06G011880 [Hibiscus cannabinus]
MRVGERVHLSLTFRNSTGETDLGGPNEELEPPGRSLAWGRQEGKRDQWYRYPIPTLESGYRYLLERVSVPLEMAKVSIPEEGYRYPFVDTPGIDTWRGISVPKFPNGT